MGDDGCERWGWQEGCDGIGVGRHKHPMWGRETLNGVQAQ